MSVYSDAILSDVPIVYYRFDEVSGTIANDKSVNGYNGSYSGIKAYTQPGAIIDDNDTAIKFTSSGGVSVPSTVNPSGWTKYTLEFWIKITGNYHHVVITYDGTTITKYLDGAISVGNSGDVILVGQNLTFAGTYNGGTLDEFALYNSIFTSTQVAWHYSIGTTGRSGIAMFPAVSRRDGTGFTTQRRGV